MDKSLAFIILNISFTILFLKCSSQASNEQYYEYKKKMNEFYILQKSSMISELFNPTSMFISFFLIPILIKSFLFYVEDELNISYVILIMSLIFLFMAIIHELIQQTNEFCLQKKFADQGDNLGQLKVGAMYENGVGTRKNYQRAEEYYLKSALQGNSIAMYFLGCLYEFGKRGKQGIAENKKEAYELIQESARRGNIEAQRRVRYIKESNFEKNCTILPFNKY